MTHTASEHVLSTSCVGVAKVNHLLRSSGEELWAESNALKGFDTIQEGTLGRLFPGSDEDALRQAALGVKAGGLGVRRATDVALPASVASKIMATPKVKQLGEDLARTGLLRPGQLEEQFSTGLQDVTTAFKLQLDAPERSQVDDLVERAQAAAAGDWERLQTGRVGSSEHVLPRAQWTGIEVDDLVEPRAGAEEALGAQGDGRNLEDEGSGEGGTPTVNNLQKQLTVLMDNTRLRDLVRTLLEPR
jgi:hypothetical protein